MKQNVPVSTIMTKNIIKLNVSDSLNKAERLFKENKIKTYSCDGWNQNHRNAKLY